MEKQVTRRPDATTTEPTSVLRCAQCGEHLEAARIRMLAAKLERLMCVDCAFDAIPCTD